MNSPVQDGCHAGMPCLRVGEVEQAVDFYTRALGAQELTRVLLTGSRGVALVQLRIGGTTVLVAAEEGPATTRPQRDHIVTHLHVEDVERTLWRAVDAGATVSVPAQDVLWGGRYGQLVDPFGYVWSLASHRNARMPPEMRRRTRAAFAEASESDPDLDHGIFDIQRGQ